MSSARLEPSATPPADDTGVVAAAMAGVTLSAPASSEALICSSSVSAGPPWSVGARATKEFPASAGAGSSGVVDALRAFPRLFLERAPERGIFFFFSDGGVYIGFYIYIYIGFVDPAVVTTMEPGLSRDPGVGVERAATVVSYSSRTWRRSGEGVVELKSKRRGRRGAEVT